MSPSRTSTPESPSTGKAFRWSPPTARRSLPQGVEAVLLDVGEGHVELLAPLGPDTAVGRFLARQGPGLHHVAYAVKDIDATLARVLAAGIETIDAEPRAGIRDSRVAFLHPRFTGGVLIEIVEPAGGH